VWRLGKPGPGQRDVLSAGLQSSEHERHRARREAIQQGMLWRARRPAGLPLNSCLTFSCPTAIGRGRAPCDTTGGEGSGVAETASADLIPDLMFLEAPADQRTGGHEPRIAAESLLREVGCQCVHSEPLHNPLTLGLDLTGEDLKTKLDLVEGCGLEVSTCSRDVTCLMTHFGANDGRVPAALASELDDRTVMSRLALLRGGGRY
jgi:hypothetical protein